MTTTENDAPEIIEGEAEEVTPAEIEEGAAALPPAVREEIAAVEQERHLPAPTGTVLPSPREWEATLAVATKIAATPFVPESYRGQPEAVVAAILTGRELGIGPMQALREIHMIDGRATFSATLMLAKLRAGGVEITESKLDDDRAWIQARRRDTGEVAEVEWRYEEATKIMRKGKALSEGANWKNYRQDMLWARCVGRLARRLGSDLLGGLVYSSEEVEEWDDSDAQYGGAGPAPGGGYFDPGRDLLGTAIRGQDAPQRLRERMDAINPAIDWTSVIVSATEHVWNRSRAELSPEEVTEFWRRLSNTVAFIDSHSDQGGGDFPPVPDEEIAKGFAYGFGYDPELPLPEAPPDEPEGAEEALSTLSEADQEIGFPEKEEE